MRAVVSFLLLTALVYRFTSAEDDNVKTACKRAMHKDYCINLLKSDKEYSDYDSSVHGLAFLALNIAKRNIEETSLFVKKELERGDLQAAEKDALIECDNQYNSAARNIINCLDDFDQESHFETKTSGKAAVTNIDACNAKIKDKNAQVAEKNHDVRVLVNTALSVAHVFGSQPNPHGKPQLPI